MISKTAGQYLVLAFALAFVGSELGCDRADSEISKKRRSRVEPIRVLATAYSVAEIAKQIGRDNVSVDWLRENNQSAAALEPNDDRRARLRAAEIVITTTAQPWTLDAGNDPYRGQRTIRLDDLIPSTTQPTTEPSLDEPAPAVGYVWLDPRVAKALAARLASSIAVLEPNWREATEERLGAFNASVNTIVAEASPATQPTPPTTQPTTAPARRAFLSLDPGYNAFAAAFGFEPIDLPGNGPIALPISRPDARAILAAAKEREIRVLFIPVETPPGLLRDLQNALGNHLTLEPLDAFGSSAARGRSTYAEVLRYNLEQLQKE